MTQKHPPAFYEIATWRDTYSVNSQYVIIDDCPFTDFFKEEQLPFLFKVDERTGLDEEAAMMIIDRLKG